MESMYFVEQKYKNKTELKMENLTHSFRETSLVLQFVKESQIKSKTVMSWSSQKKNEDIPCTAFFLSEGNLFDI